MMGKAGGCTRNLTPQPDAHTPSVTRDSASSVQVRRPLFPGARHVCLKLCICLRASVSLSMGDAHSRISAAFPGHGAPPPPPRLIPLNELGLPQEGKHPIKLGESVFFGKKETTRLRFSSKLSFPLMDLRKGRHDGSAGKRGGGPRRPDVQPARWRRRRPRSPRGAHPSTLAVWTPPPQARHRCCSGRTQVPGPPGAAPHPPVGMPSLLGRVLGAAAVITNLLDLQAIS
ncbi:unnamed protein product [Rangifer tarandus platyrhynchus]|uniref:Uncharacterized protein n=2 Tax=Rangifer tarandus platyrhynchus TaxID=3082113 RepID=A0ACB0E5K3_RANTA|nr:unnamed protein product [Rangifer tarandus platyrhynchus]CAI9695927.1 unnamed protein product [Rangifer tarandus platyrhynchus]